MSSTAPTTSSSDGSSLEEQLKAILARSAPLSLNKDDLQLILPALTPASAPSKRTLALALLARALTPSPTKSTLDSLRTAVEDRLAGTDSTDLVVGLSTLSAVLQVAPSSAVSYLKEGAVRKNLEEAVEYITSPTASKSGKGGERLALVELLSLAAGQSALRAQIRASAVPWLESVVGEPSQDVLEKEVQITALAAVGIVKLRLGTEKPEEGGSAEGSETKELPSKWTLPQLAVLFVKLFTSTAPSTKEKATITLEPSTTQTLLACLEGMAYLTLVSSPTIKPAIATGPLLDALLSLLPATTPPTSSSPLDFAVATLLDHLTAFPPPVDAKGEAAQINWLKAFASAKQKTATPPKPELTSSVTTRVSLIVSHLPLPTLRQLCLSPSLACRRLAARITLSLVTPTTLRGTLLQGGIARFALTLVRQIPTPFNPTEDVFAVQALAKLLITTNPLLVLGPSASSPLLAEGINALTLPLAVANEEDFGGGGTGLLVKFECLMALTNIASLDAAVVAGVKLKPSSDDSAGGGRKLLAIVEELMLSSNTMVRRAATELMCNVVASQPGFEHYAATPFPSNPRPTDAAPSPTSHLHLIIALASSPDLQTRLAASGALTSLAMEPTLALTLALYPRGLEILLALVAEEDQEGLRHRAYDVLRSLANGVGAANDEAWKERGRKGLEEAGVRKVLKEAVEGKEKVAELREVAKEALVAME